MRIERIILKEIDPLKIFTEKALLPDHEETEEQEEHEEESEENRKIAEIWESMIEHTEDSEPGALRDLFHLGPDLADLALLLNRSDVQTMLEKLIEEGEKKGSPPEKREISNRVKKNLAALNGRIARENSLWFRRIPLLLRVRWQIDRIKIPQPKNRA